MGKYLLNGNGWSINGRKSLQQIHEWACIHMKVLISFSWWYSWVYYQHWYFICEKTNKQKRTEDLFYFGWVEVMVALGIWWFRLRIPLWFLFTCLWQCLKTFSFFDSTGTHARGRACAHTPSNIGMCSCSLLAHTNKYTHVSVVGAAKC